MCFRPPDTTSGPIICSSCGKKIVSPNFTPVTCPFCKEPLEAPGSAAPSVPGVPGAPGAPKAPGAPVAPKAPGAPKPPSTQNVNAD